MFTSILVLAALAASVSAHFQLHFPVPRGPFVMDQEPTFCDGYNNAVSNRSEFPLDNGFITLNSEHPQWTAAVLISIEQDPTNFSVFNTSTTGVKLPLVHSFFAASGEGVFCIPLDIGASNIPGVGDGSNVTIQIEYDGGDGELFQCADLTLSSSFTIPSNISCTNVVGNSTNTTAEASAASVAATATLSGSASGSTTSAPATGSSSAAEHLSLAGSSSLLFAIGALIMGVL